MKRMIRLAAVLLAWGGTIAATTAYSANFGQGATAQASSEELSKLAAELAQTAARLAELEKQKSDEPAQSSQSSGSTVRWLTDGAATPASYPKTGDSQILASEIFAEGPRVVQLGTASPRPALRSFHTGPVTLAAPSKSSIIRVQAMEGDLAPVPEPNPWEDDSPTTSKHDAGSASCTDSCCDTCCEPSCDSCCDVCCEPSCDGCCDTCCGHAKCRRCIVTVGTEVVFLGADINGQRIGYLFEDAVADEVIGLGPAFGDGELDDFYVAPRLTLGIQGECWGIQGRYFHFRAAEHAHDPIQPDGAFPNHSFDTNSIFEAYYTDVELTRNFCIHGCKNQFSFGARYAAIEHHENIYARSFSDPVLFDPNTALLTGYGRSNREAYGTGLTFGLNGRKPLFCNACANWFYSARGSILWGPTTNEAETEAGSSYGNASAGSVDTGFASVDDDLFIGELQAGIEWDFALRCLPAKAFFRIAAEYQYWDASAGFAEAGSFAGIQQDPGPPVIDQGAAVTASAPGLIVDLYGFTIGTGFTW